MEQVVGSIYSITGTNWQIAELFNSYAVAMLEPLAFQQFIMFLDQSQVACTIGVHNITKAITRLVFEM